MLGFLLDSDVVIWHLRGKPSVVDLVMDLAGRGRLLVSAVTRAEVLVGLREEERPATLRFLDACATMPVDQTVADRAAALIRAGRSRGVTVHLPDALIGATAAVHAAPLFTCNTRHYSSYDIDVRQVG